jgi:hypothetical protein
MNENISTLETNDDEQGYKRLIRYLRKEMEGENHEKTNVEEANSNQSE